MVTEASDCVAVEAWKRRWGEPQLAFTTKRESEICVHGDGSGFFRILLGQERPAQKVHAALDSGSR